MHRRGQAMLHLMSNTQHLGLIVRSDYLHLSRSLFAAAGSYASIYEGTERWTMVRDLARAIGRFPWLLVRDKVDVRVRNTRERFLSRLPLGPWRREREIRRIAHEMRIMPSTADSS